TFDLLYTNEAILIGLVYSYLPFMVLPLYASLEKMDFRLIEAASDLYASKWQAARHVIIPLAKPGIIAGSLLVFIPSIGAFIAPDLLGGGKRLMLGSLIHFQFATARNWPFGAAVSILLMVFVMVALLIYNRANKGQGVAMGGH
ncbi:MAG: ABC transporter permease, partial [Alphaproteobacteria bacterium]|nr:ABC transporter permease [Alphaproteobacteria bacterium]